MIRIHFLVTAVVAVTCFIATPASAQFTDNQPANALFSQYATPNGPSLTTAGMYPAPHYVPPMGAQSYYTYQPLMPHEMMYQHSRNYYNYSSSTGYGAPDSVTKTSVRWFSGTNHIGQLKIGGCLSGLCYRMQSHRYGLGGCEGDDCGGGAGCGHRLKKRCSGCGHSDCGGSCGSASFGAAPAGGCASGCSANLSDGSLQR